MNEDPAILARIGDPARRSYAVLIRARIVDVFEAEDDDAAVTRARAAAASEQRPLVTESGLAAAAVRAGLATAELSQLNAIAQADLTVRLVTPEMFGSADDLVVRGRFFDAVAVFIDGARCVEWGQWQWTAEITGRLGEVDAAARTGVVAMVREQPALYFTRESVLLDVRARDLDLLGVNHFEIQMLHEPAEVVRALEQAYDLPLLPVPFAFFDGKYDPVDPYVLQTMSALLVTVGRYWRDGEAVTEYRPAIGGNLTIRLEALPDRPAGTP
jgi:hypothetical protein